MGKISEQDERQPPVENSGRKIKSIGERLKAERESKGLSVDDVARDINMARRHIMALESENFSQFSAETYLLGFLKNYGEYLGLDVKELLSAYRIIKIQEQPVPIEPLLHTPVDIPRTVIKILIAAVVIALLGGSAYYFFLMPKNVKVEEQIVRVPVEYSLTEGFLENRFYEGDTLVIPAADNSYKILLRPIGDVITLAAPGKEIKLGLNNEALADINGDGVPELRISAVDYAQNRNDVGAQLRFEILNTGNQQEAALTVSPDTPAPDQPPATAAGRNIIFEGPSAYPFTLQAVFSGYCMFRWEIMREANRQNRTERYFVKDEEQTIQAQNGIRFWASNSSAVKIWIIGGGHNVPLELGGPGEVLVEDIYWVFEDDRYKLIQVKLES
ncbi:MAG: helix-turn-helix domain-containing protein [Spirochaetaceae bacterium]|jgi:cytoskeletal protein RodZ|nr:helix-turn-helix domain-containing protein [Spirochaetaceae bacterium]